MRKKRVKLLNKHTAYHVMTRTCQQVFNLCDSVSPGFKAKCRTILEQMVSVYYIDLHAWTFMDNHFHLCISVNKPKVDEKDIQRRYERLQSFNVRANKWHDHFLEKCHHRFTDLSWFMWDLNRRIAMAFNKLHGTVGHLWGDRFKSKVIEDNPAILRVMAYIEQNPVKANIVTKPSDYEACSTADNLNLAKAGKPSLTKPVGWLKQVPSKQFGWIYASFMNWLAEVRFGKEEKPPMPTAFAKYRHEIPDIGNWAKLFNEGEPVNWAQQGYGSQTFIEEIKRRETNEQSNAS